MDIFLFVPFIKCLYFRFKIENHLFKILFKIILLKIFAYAIKCLYFRFNIENHLFKILFNIILLKIFAYAMNFRKQNIKLIEILVLSFIF